MISYYTCLTSGCFMMYNNYWRWRQPGSADRSGQRGQCLSTILGPSQVPTYTKYLPRAAPQRNSAQGAVCSYMIWRYLQDIAQYIQACIS